MYTFLLKNNLFSEIGHNWGSLHDPPGVCEDQHFLMNAFAQSGDDPNNYVSSFSSVLLAAVFTCCVCRGFLIVVGL